VVETDSVLNLEEVKSWNELMQKGKVLDEASCDAILDLQSEDESDDDYEDIDELRAQLHAAEERDKELSRQLKDAQSQQDHLDSLDYGRSYQVGARHEDDEIVEDMNFVARVYDGCSGSARNIEAASSAVAFESSDCARYLSSEEEFRSCLTSFSKQLLSTPMSLLDSAMKTSSHSPSLWKDADLLDDLEKQYRDASKRLAQGKMELKYQQLLSSRHVEDTSGTLSKFEPNAENLRGRFSSVLRSASKAFVFCKDSSDLDLQLNRLRFCDEAKGRVLERLNDQLSRHVVFADLLCADISFHLNLERFFCETKDSISRVASKKSSFQRSLDVVSSFANAPPIFAGSALASGFSALMRLVDDDIPQLPDSTGSGRSEWSIEKTIAFLAAGWNSREHNCDEKVQAWGEELEKCGSGTFKMEDRLTSESRVVSNPRITIEMLRLGDKQHMAKKCIRRAVELIGRAPPMNGSRNYLLAKAPVCFHTNTEEFDKLVRLIMDS